MQGIFCGVHGLIPYQSEDMYTGNTLFFSRRDNSAVKDTAVGSDLIRELLLITNKITMSIQEWEAFILVSIFYGLASKRELRQWVRKL